MTEDNRTDKTLPVQSFFEHDESVTEDNRITQIRVVLDEDASIRARFQVDTSASYGPRFLSRIRAILDVSPPAPRVFLPGDVVPAGVAVMLDDGSLLEADTMAEKQTEQDGPAVELLGIPTLEQWQDLVDRARAARETP